MQIIENGRVTHVVDARDENHSNWLRFVNCARNEDEQNLVAFQFRGEIYYRSYKVIEPGMELLVWYGDRYACDLDILNKDQSDKIAGMCSLFLLCDCVVEISLYFVTTYMYLIEISLDLSQMLFSVLPTHYLFYCGK